MSKVSINAPKTPVTKGSSGVAAATMPNVCKMPGPPAPFAPTPLPNIGDSGKSPDGYSKTVTIGGQPVAIAGASFGSSGDVASKGTGGGLVSSNVEGPTKFIGPGSFDVQIEGKNVQLLGDPMLNNCGPSGSPPNSATMTGVMQAPGVMAILYGDDAPCRLCVEAGRTPSTHEGIPIGEATKAGIAEFYKRMQQKFDAQKTAIQQLPELRRRAMDPVARQRPRNVIAHEVQLIKDYAEKIQTDAILRLEADTGTHSQGYMFGLLICMCSKGEPKRFAAVSGHAPIGFANLAKELAFELACPVAGAPISSPSKPASSPASTWACAAKQMIERLGTHRPGQMVERWFAPTIPGLMAKRPNTRTREDGKVVKSGGFTLVPHGEGFTDVIKTLVTDLDGSRRLQEASYGTGEQVPSCSRCQTGLPELYCNNKCTG